MLRDIFEDNNLGLIFELCRVEVNSSDFGDGIVYFIELIVVGIFSKVCILFILSVFNKYYLFFYYKVKIF